MRTSLRSLLRLAFLSFVATVTTVLVAVPAAHAAQPDDPTAGRPWQEGPASVALGQGVALELPGGRRFLGQPEAGRLMDELGNLHNEDLLGVVLPTALDEEWMITLRFEPGGFIKDDERLDSATILHAIREGEPAYNQERAGLGFPPVHADGWMEEPRYDRASHQMVWALVVSSERGVSVNLNTRLLGRKGFVSLNLVTPRNELARYRPVGAEMLGATRFEHGNRYEDFDPRTDPVAEYGLTGLVLGGAGVGLAKAAKLGALAKVWKGLAALLLAGKKGLVALVAGLLAFARKLFRGRMAAAVSDGDVGGARPPA